jgi:CopG family nickel-responsive transcriptional regulator
MERFTISLKPDLAGAFDEFIQARGYSNRSEAVRDLIRERLEQERLEREEGGQCVATLSYVYNHHELALASRLTSAHHAHHDLSLSTMHVHLDHDTCLETVMLRGSTQAVRRFAEEVIAERGVRHGRLHMIPVEVEVATHSHTAAPGHAEAQGHAGADGAARFEPAEPHSHSHTPGMPHVHRRPRT